MAYCTITDLTNRIPESVLIQLTQDDKVRDQADTDRVNAAIVDSDALIDSKLHLRYTVPLTTVPANILRIACDIAIFYIYRARFDHTMPESVKEAFQDAVSYLNSVRDGDEMLPGIEITEDEVEDFILCNQLAADKVYTQDTLDTI